MLKIIMANKGVRNAKEVKSIETALTMAQVIEAINLMEQKTKYKRTPEETISEIKMNRYRGK